MKDVPVALPPGLTIAAVLPREDAGRARARAMDLTVVRRTPDPEPSDAAPPEAPAGLESAWKRYAALANLVPAPEAYGPALWRLYQDLVLRYEVKSRPTPA